DVIRQAVDPDANVIFGVVLDPNIGNELRLTLIATGFATREALAGGARDKEITQLLKGMKGDELDIPSFLRHRQAYSAAPRPRSASSLR
ncbi:MAG: cell division protein FtsZ, partial [Chloroflexi bacterium]|nr:cell division protein FtsZ [Chloroflexota bacterium]